MYTIRRKGKFAIVMPTEHKAMTHADHLARLDPGYEYIVEQGVVTPKFITSFQFHLPIQRKKDQVSMSGEY